MTPVDTLGILDLLNQHLGWYPLLEVQDVYKLLYQGVMGSEHLMPSIEEYSSSLASEYGSIQPDATRQLFEPVRADGKLFRINLGPLKTRGIGLAGLISPLIHTTQVVRGTKNELENTWNTFIELCLQGYVVCFDLEEVERFTGQVEQLGYPAVHHSERYTRAYQPSYRLVAAQFVGQLGLGDAD
jgi:hypothetical protein